MSGIIVEATNKLLGGVSAIAIGAYLIAVVFKGNTQELLALIKGETGYIDFVVALFILGAISHYGPTSKISSILIAATLIGLVIRVGGHMNFLPAITKFANGEAGILETLRTIISPT